MLSQENSDTFKNSVISLLLFRHNIPVRDSLDMSETWLIKNPQESWETLSELLKKEKIVVKQGVLSKLPQLSSAEAIDFAQEMQSKNGVEIKNRWFKLKSYPNCFIGSEMVSWLMQNKNMTLEEAVAIGKSLLEEGLIYHVHHAHDFKNEFLFYRFKDN